MAPLEPWQSWAAFGVIIAPLAIYYGVPSIQKQLQGGGSSSSNASKRRASQGRGSGTEARSGSGKDKKKGKAKTGGRINDDDAVEASSSFKSAKENKEPKSRKGGNKSNHAAQSSAVDTTPAQGNMANDMEEDIDNREFAKQMSGLKTGTSLTKTDNSKNKSKKQGKQAELPLNSFNALPVNGASTSKDLSIASSTTGADADDDLSPATSPPVGAAQTATSGDISDMLEAPAKGHSVLRLTGTEKEKPQAKVQKSAQQPETKKQRQQRRKNEEKKEAREQAERERKALLEKQRRTAREAEGRPAKNGVGSAPTTNAWNQSSSTNNLTSSTLPSSTNTMAPIEQTRAQEFAQAEAEEAKYACFAGGLLDTFDNGSKPVANGQAKDDSEDNSELYREREEDFYDARKYFQEHLLPRELNEPDDSGWKIVDKSGKAKKKANAGNDKDGDRKPSGVGLSTSDTDDKTVTPKDTAPKATTSKSQLEDDPPKPKKLTRHDIDHSVWTRDNIHLHPAYEPENPYALTGHPMDSDWDP
ncbi:MAG: hypothetical protein Q9183_004353 [Haloplaca sp. 2 TL-2023]